MPALQECPRTLVVCTRCQSPIAARELTDGTIRPIGSGKACPCGCDDFREYGSAESLD